MQRASFPVVRVNNFLCATLGFHETKKMSVKRMRIGQQLLTNVKFEVSDSTWPGVLKKLDPVLSALFKDCLLMTSIKLGSV